jgi:pullulanase/glycogen debranching enzyme
MKGERRRVLVAIQRRNNNVYCQDNEISWVDWDSGDDTR